MPPKGYRKHPDNKRHGKRRAPPFSFYIGADEIRTRRIKALDKIAEPFGGRSRMIQQIADGELVVTPAKKPT